MPWSRLGQKRNPLIPQHNAPPRPGGGPGPPLGHGRLAPGPRGLAPPPGVPAARALHHDGHRHKIWIADISLRFPCARAVDTKSGLLIFRYIWNYIRLYITQTHKNRVRSERWDRCWNRGVGRASLCRVVSIVGTLHGTARDQGMALQPAPPVRGYSFTDWQVANPTAPPPGDKLDAEYDRADTTISQTISWAAVSLLTDGTIRHGVIGKPQLVSGLFDDVAQGIIDDVQPMVDQAGAYAASALTSANEADGSAAEAEVANVAAQNAKTLAETAQAGADLAKVDAQTSAAIAGTKATDAQNHANHAAGDAALAEDWGIVSRDWAEHMPDTIPPNTLAVMGVTGDHWSARWWANQAAANFSLTRGIATSLVYAASAGQTVFPMTVVDLHGNTFTMDPADPGPLDVFVKGLRLPSAPAPSASWTVNPATSTVTLSAPLAAGDIVQIDALTLGGPYLQLSGGTVHGPVEFEGGVNMPGLPSDPAGLTTGDVFINGGVLMVMP